MIACVFFFFMQKTAYDMRISDWSSDVCSSDLLTYGKVVIAMRPDLAPKTVARIKELVRKGFYDGIVFHRVIRGFMAQTGDPTGPGTGGPGQKLKAELSSAPPVSGTGSMARHPRNDTPPTPFFICSADHP